MKKSRANPTMARNLEKNVALGKRDIAGKAASAAVERCGRQLTSKFDRGENVLDYFDVRRAHVIDPQSKGEARKGNLARFRHGNTNRSS